MKYLDIVERAYTGEKVSKQDWDIDYVAMPIMEILDDFDLSYEKGEVIAFDDDMLRRFYQAGRRLAVESGIYCQDTGRIIQFTEKEIDEAAANQKKEMMTGQGTDGFVFRSRKPEDKNRPGVVAGNPGCPMNEDEFRKTVESWAKEPSIDMVTCGSIVDVEGHAVRRAEPGEVIALKHELSFLNEICARVGRPYVGRLAAESSVSQIGDLAAFGPDGIRPGDAHLVAINNELVMTTDNMIRAAMSENTGVLNASLACVMVGGVAGNAAGAAVCMIASMLLANLICKADYHLCHPIHLKQIATSTPECMWLQSVVCQAFALCAPNIIICDIYPKNGAGTKELLYEVAAESIVITVSGGNLEGCGSCDGIKPNCSGLECRMMGMVGAACAKAGLTRKDGEKIVKELLKKYEYTFDNRQDGFHITEVYDMDTMEPKAFWQQMFDEVAAELRGLGLEIGE